MQNFLFHIYQFVCILLFLLLSAVMLYNRLFQRWLKFSTGFLVVYFLGSYFFFGKVLVPFTSKEAFHTLSYFLFFFGTIACAGSCLIRGMSLRQSIGIVLCYFFVLFGFILILGAVAGVEVRLPQEGAVQALLMTLPYILFYAGSPLVVGYCLYRCMSVREITGIYLMFCAILGLMIIGTTNFFNLPFGFFYELNPHARAWVEVGSALLVIVGLPAVIGYCLFYSLSVREAFGAVVVFLAVMTAIVALIQLTIGYEYVPKFISVLSI